MDFYIEKDKNLHGVNFFKDDSVHFEVMLTKHELLQLVQQIFAELDLDETTKCQVNGEQVLANDKPVGWYNGTITFTTNDNNTDC